MKHFHFFFLLLFSVAVKAQNFVPNPGFENTCGCTSIQPNLNCLDFWKDYSDPVNPNLNTPDVCYNTAVFFPLVSINAFEGSNYMGLDCGAANPEYVQVNLLSPLGAGTTYCVSFYASLFDQWNTPTPFIGAHFSNTPVTVNPFISGITAQVQAPGPTDPTVWVQISGTFVAAGGEEYMTMGCFQGNVPTVFSYNYIDMIDVHPMNISVDLGPDQQVCADMPVTLDAGTGGTSYLWGNGETTQTITTTTAGVYWVEKFSGVCPVTDTIELFSTGCNDPIDPVDPTDPEKPVDPVPPVIPVAEGTLFIPNSFSPNGDGINDVFGAKAENISNFEMIVYDRWGEKVFYSSDPGDQWNGKFRNADAKEDVYVYVLNYTNGNKKKIQRGHVVLVR